MDLDAHVKQLQNFRKEILALFPGGVIPKFTDEQIRAAGLEPRLADVPRMADIPVELHAEIKQLQDRHTKLDEAVKELQALPGLLQMVSGVVSDLQAKVAGLQAAQDTPKIEGGTSEPGAETDAQAPS